MKVLLVDDEMITIRMLKSIIPWEQIGLSCMGYAQSGEEAYKMAMQEMPDIILTDIRMKNMDGLELVEKLHKIPGSAKIILMSAYADFGYVKEGIRLGVSNYILKPVDENELEQALRKVIEEIRGKQNEKKRLDQSERQLRTLELYRYMRGGSRRNKIFEHKKEYAFDFENYSMILIQKDNDTIDDYINTSNIELIRENYVLHMLEKLIGEECGKKFLSMDYEDDAWMVLLEDVSGKEVVEICEKMVVLFHEELELKVLICFGEEGRALEELPQMYERVKSLQKYAYFIGDERILGYGYNCEWKQIDQLRGIGLVREAEQAVAAGDIARLEEIVEEAFKESAVFYSDGLRDIYEFSYRIMYAIHKTLGDEREVTYNGLREYDSLKRLRAAIDNAVAGLKGREESGSGRHYSKPVEESLRMIEKNYNKNLSLEEISEAIAVSKNYFCYLFKREVGVSLWNYLTEVRMRHAKELLQETEMKTYQIAFEVGYDNPSYFSKIFKKLENVTPNEYRAGKREYSDRK